MTSPHDEPTLDDVLERIVRHRDPDSETNQAGLATRLVAAVIDLGLLSLLYSAGRHPAADELATVSAAVPDLTGHPARTLTEVLQAAG